MKRNLVYAIAAALAMVVLLGTWSETRAASFEEQIALGKASFRLGNDQGDLNAFFQARDDFRAATTSNPNHPLGHYYVALADWRLARELSDDGASQIRIEELADEGLKSCDRALALAPNHAETIAIKGILLTTLGSVRASERQNLYAMSESTLRRACEISPRNPRVWLMVGIDRFERPAANGGGTEVALRELRRALELFERDTQTLEALSGGSPPLGRGQANPITLPSPVDQSGDGDENRARRASFPLEPDWGHDEAWLWAGKAHMTNEQFDAARRCFLKALEVNPSNAEVRDELLPECEEAISGMEPVSS